MKKDVESHLLAKQVDRQDSKVSEYLKNIDFGENGEADP